MIYDRPNLADLTAAVCVVLRLLCNSLGQMRERLLVPPTSWVTHPQLWGLDTASRPSRGHISHVIFYLRRGQWCNTVLMRLKWADLDETFPKASVCVFCAVRSLLFSEKTGLENKVSEGIACVRRVKRYMMIISMVMTMLMTMMMMAVVVVVVV